MLRSAMHMIRLSIGWFQHTPSTPTHPHPLLAMALPMTSGSTKHGIHSLHRTHDIGTIQNFVEDFLTATQSK
jgi:hypothetical protein